MISNLDTRKNARRIAASLIALSSVALLTGCGATGNDSPTRNIRQVTDGKDFESGDIKVRNLQLQANADGTASLIGTFINSGSSADAITGIVVNGAPIKLSTPMIALNPNTPVIFGGATSNATGQYLGTPLVAGNHATVNIAFGTADAATSNVLIKN